MAQATLAGPQQQRGGDRQQQRQDDQRGDDRQQQRAVETNAERARRLFQELRANLNGKTFRERILASVAEENRNVGYIERLCESILAAVRANHKLITECSRPSLFAAAEQAAKAGLTVGNNICWIVPYKGEAQYQLGYKGAMIIVLRSQLISKVSCQPVFANDKCTIHLGSSKRIDHDVPLGPRGAFVGVYAIAWLKDVEEPEIEWMDKATVDYIRERSPGANSPAWVNWYSEMARAKVLKRCCKFLPTERPMELDDADDRVIEGTAATDIGDSWYVDDDKQIENTGSRDQQMPMDTGRQDDRQTEPDRVDKGAKQTRAKATGATKPAAPTRDPEPDPTPQQEPEEEQMRDEDRYTTMPDDDPDSPKFTDD